MEIDRESATYRRATNAGWTFGPATVKYENHPMDDILLIEGEFNCVCGRREKYSVRISALTLDYEEIARNGKIDIALWLDYHGSFSRQHLLEDGYTEEQVRSIESKFNAPLFDEVRSTSLYYGTHLPVQSFIPN